VYAKENIIHLDGKTGILYKAGSQVATMTVDKKGDASVEDLYLGKYYVKEITPPIGYLIDEGEYDLEFINKKRCMVESKSENKMIRRCQIRITDRKPRMPIL